MEVDKSDYFVFTLSAPNLLIGYGVMNNKFLLIETDVNEDVNCENKVVMKFLDYLLYRYFMDIIFETNKEATEIYINRFDIESGEDDCLYLTKQEYELLKGHFL